MSELVRRQTEARHFGPIARCTVHKMQDGCECSWPDCVKELVQMDPDYARATYVAAVAGDVDAKRELLRRAAKRNAAALRRLGE